MKIPQAIIDRYGLSCDQGAGKNVIDADALAILQTFDETPDAKVLFAGCHDDRLANMFAAAGFEVVGFDLREYEEGAPPCNYRFVCGDFCQMPHEFVARHAGTFDAFVASSTIEHFGLGGYGETFFHPYYDVLAMQTVKRMLKPGGHAYVTVPYGKKFIERYQDWRVYDEAALMSRLIHPAGADHCYMAYFTSGPAVVGGRPLTVGTSVSKKDADSYDGEPTWVTALFKARKG